MITTNELTKELKVSRQMVHKLRKQGMPHIRFNQKTIRYDLEEVKQWFKNKK